MRHCHTSARPLLCSTHTQTQTEREREEQAALVQIRLFSSKPNTTFTNCNATLAMGTASRNGERNWKHGKHTGSLEKTSPLQEGARAGGLETAIGTGRLRVPGPILGRSTTPELPRFKMRKKKSVLPRVLSRFVAGIAPRQLIFA